MERDRRSAHTQEQAESVLDTRNTLLWTTLSGWRGQRNFEKTSYAITTRAGDTARMLVRRGAGRSEWQERTDAGGWLHHATGEALMESSPGWDVDYYMPCCISSAPTMNGEESPTPHDAVEIGYPRGHSSVRREIASCKAIRRRC